MKMGIESRENKNELKVDAVLSFARALSKPPKGLFDRPLGIQGDCFSARKIWEILEDGVYGDDLHHLEKCLDCQENLKVDQINLYSETDFIQSILREVKTLPPESSDWEAWITRPRTNKGGRFQPRAIQDSAQLFREHFKGLLKSHGLSPKTFDNMVPTVVGLENHRLKVDAFNVPKLTCVIMPITQLGKKTNWDVDYIQAKGALEAKCMNVVVRQVTGQENIAMLQVELKDVRIPKRVRTEIINHQRITDSFSLYAPFKDKKAGYILGQAKIEFWPV